MNRIATMLAVLAATAPPPDVDDQAVPLELLPAVRELAVRLDHSRHHAAVLAEELLRAARGTTERVGWTATDNVVGLTTALQLAAVALLELVDDPRRADLAIRHLALPGLPSLRTAVVTYRQLHRCLGADPDQVAG